MLTWNQSRILGDTRGAIDVTSVRIPGAPSEISSIFRLRSIVSACEAVIELKLADGRSARDLHDTIYDQLVRKYMAGENSKSGRLLITLAKDRNWEHH
ncbi:MAG TPA: hypothetical protein VF534_28925 [Paraburkholderia sp.]